ncbi:uncharacterized protein LOC114829781 [Esox lucius]|uniref:uncharacterized protein LOC114829781 n=1 Tax=Esox lucius TaxID=8010 RepID=UPI0014776F7B|nr:uncharacterized protein LOC114829781 [Esox lucius]
MLHTDWIKGSFFLQKTMASTIFFNGKGLLLFLLGLQTTAFVSGQNTTVATNSTTLYATNDSSASSASISPNVYVKNSTIWWSTTNNTGQAAPTEAASTSYSTQSGANPMAGNETTNIYNATSWDLNDDMDSISCPQFSCNYSECIKEYQNVTPVLCPDNVTFCQLWRNKDMTYISNCSAYCSNACVNYTQTNCAMGCCNLTGCLNSTLASMNPTNTTSVTTMMTSTPSTTTKTMGTTTINAQPLLTSPPKGSSSATRGTHFLHSFPMVTAALLACLLSAGSIF